MNGALKCRGLCVALFVLSLAAGGCRALLGIDDLEDESTTDSRDGDAGPDMDASTPTGGTGGMDDIVGMAGMGGSMGP